MHVKLYWNYEKTGDFTGVLSLCVVGHIYMPYMVQGNRILGHIYIYIMLYMVFKGLIKGFLFILTTDLGFIVFP